MKKYVIASVAVLIVGLLAVIVGVSQDRAPDPGDFSYWMKSSAGKDWSTLAAQGDAEAQFHHAFALIRTNFVMNKDQVPGLSAIPVLGRRYFQNVSYRIDSKISPARLAEAHDLIKKSAARGFPPAREAEKLFVGKSEMSQEIPGEPR